MGGDLQASKVRGLIQTTLSRPVAFQPIFARITGSVAAGLMLSQAWYWTPRTDDPHGWFYKSQREWQDEICLTRCEQETARRTLRRLRLLEEWRRGNPARLWFRVNLDELCTQITRLVTLSERSRTIPGIDQE